MTQWIWDRTAALARWWIFLPLFAAACYVTTLFPKYPAKSFEGTYFYAAGDAESILKALGEDGRSSYLHTERTVDVIYPLLYAFTFAIAIVGAGRAVNASRWLVILPYATAFFDYIENSCAIAMLLRYGDGKPLGLFPYVGSIATPLKTVLFVDSWLAAVVLAILWVVWRLRQMLVH